MLAMPITSSAKKALRGSARKRDFNDSRKIEVKNAVKKLKKLVSTGNLEEARKLMPSVQKAIDKGSKRGIFKKNTASRKKSRISNLLKKTSAK